MVCFHVIDESLSSHRALERIGEHHQACKKREPAVLKGEFERKEERSCLPSNCILQKKAVLFHCLSTSKAPERRPSHAETGRSPWVDAVVQASRVKRGLRVHGLYLPIE